jgi:uncharacterized protein YecT (DUF1311 family)
MRVLPALFLALLLSALPARADDCDNATTQAAMTQCAADAYASADKALNQTYQGVMAKLDAAGQDKLKQAQRTWIKYRDSHCKAAAADVKGGSLYPAVLNGCLAETTQARTAELKGTPQTRGGE